MAKITVLIRTHNRPAAFARCMESLRSQTFTDYRVFVSVQSKWDYEYTRPLMQKGDKVFMVEGGEGYFYNLHCNVLKSKVTTGYFFFLDDDDELTTPYSLEYLAEQLTGDGVICQFNRGGWLKPTKEMVEHRALIEGQVGMPCLVLHSKHRNIANIENDVSGDYHWIKSVSEQTVLKWLQFALVMSERRNYGRSI